MKLGVFLKSWVMRGFWDGSGQVLDESWARPGQLLAILVSFWEALGLSWAALGRSWAVFGALGKLLGSSWTLLGSSWALLGCSWAALDRSWAPSWSQDGRQEAQSRPQDPPKSKPRRYKTMLTYKKLFRSPFWELHRSFWRPFCRMLGAPGAQK